MSDNNLSELFNQHQWRYTANVDKIVQCLKSEKGLISAYELQAKLEHNPDVTTIYRLLEKLQTLKLVHEFQGKWRWCKNPENKNESHHFLICENCGCAEEVFLDYEETIAQQLKRERGFQLRRVHLGFLGVCQECQ